jgi:hypothetical protein
MGGVDVKGRPIIARGWRSNGTNHLSSPAEAQDLPPRSFRQWFLPVTGDRCSKTAF